MPSCSSGSECKPGWKTIPTEPSYQWFPERGRKLEQDSSMGRNYLVFFLNSLDEKEYADKSENDIRRLKKAVGGQD